MTMDPEEEDLLEELGLEGVEGKELSGESFDMDEELEEVEEDEAELEEAGDESPDPIRLYLRDMSRTPLLTPEQEEELARRMAEGREALERLASDEHLTEEERRQLAEKVREGNKARDHLIRANTRLVIQIAKRYRGWGIAFSDLIQEGNLGLMRAADKFDYRRGTRFSTYATWWIRQAITRALSDQGRTIRLPVHIHEEIRRLHNAEELLNDRLGRQPTDEEIAQELGLALSRVRWLRRIARHTVSLETPIGEDGDNSLGDFVQDDDTSSPTEKASQTLLKQEVAKLLEHLKPREAEIIRLRFGFVDGRSYTLKEVGEKLGITRERVRQIESKALRRLRHPSRSQRVRDFIQK
ncbi:MAG: sigma-70 family RNA polymerase sigma factor [Anaerolineae bacterium]|nr:sigma-70 family RNA polymerase sigma factor [Anaerolineae bacterium]